MARVAISNIAEPNLESARNKDYPSIGIDFNPTQSTVKDLSSIPRFFRNKDFGILRPRLEERYAKAQTILPFRISFSSVDIPGYGRENPAPIGIAVIGSNNYIL